MNSVFGVAVLLLSFNRYMVECKFSILIFDNNTFFVLIDTWWNVNFFQDVLPFQALKF